MPPVDAAPEKRPAPRAAALAGPAATPATFSAALAAAPRTPTPTPLPRAAAEAPGRPATPGAAAAPPAGKVKGTLLISRMKYLRARGDEEFERVLRRMPASDQPVLRGMLLPSSWYDANLLVRLETTIVALLSRGQRRELFLDMGKFTADTNLGPAGVQRPYLQPGDPQVLLRNVPRMYAAQHSGGVRTYEQVDGKTAVVRTVEGEGPSAEDCLTAVGWLKRAIELSGGKLVSVEETRCRARHDGCCEYVCRWL